MEDNPHGGGDQGPKVDTSVSAECAQDLDEHLQGIVNTQREEDDDEEFGALGHGVVSAHVAGAPAKQFG
jgi:hypothetical protein